MQTTILKQELIKFSKSMSAKDILGSFHGSISAKFNTSEFIINKKNADLSSIDESDLLELFFLKDYSWKDASIDASIHTNIYKNIPDAKFFIIAYPLYTNSYALHHSHIEPLDYHGFREFNGIKIIDPKNYEDWSERASSEILQHFLHNNTSIVIIRGYGVCIYDRELSSITKRLSILEYSCKLLVIDKFNALK